MNLFNGVNRDEVSRLAGELTRVQIELQKMYERELESNKLATRMRIPLSGDASTLEVVCQAIDDAVNVLTRAFPDAD